MDIIYKFNKQTRTIEEIIDTKIAAQMANGENIVSFADIEDYPVYYVIKVQIKIWFLWITVWERHCDISDSDTRQYIIREANQLLKIMEGKSDEERQ